MACGILEGEFANWLRNRLRQGYPAGYLDLAQAYSALQTSIQHGRLQTSDTEYARLMFLVNRSPRLTLHVILFYMMMMVICITYITLFNTYFSNIKES